MDRDVRSPLREATRNAASAAARTSSTSPEAFAFNLHTGGFEAAAGGYARGVAAAGFRPATRIPCVHMFAPDNTSFQRLLDGVDLVIDASTLGEYGLEIVAAQPAATIPEHDAATPQAGCPEEPRRRRRLPRRRRPRRPSGQLRDNEPYSFDFPPSPAGEPIVVGPFRIAPRAQAPLTLGGGRQIARLS